VLEKLMLLAAFVASMMIMGENHRRKRKKIVFLGDSLTAYGARPGGFIRQIEGLMKEADVENKYVLVGAGVEGDTVSSLYRRLDKDVLSEGADVAVVLIGINDVLEGNETDAFEDDYQAVIKKLASVGIKVVLCTLTIVGEDETGENSYDEVLDTFSAVIRNLALANELPVVDLRNAFLNHNRTYNYTEAGDLLTYDHVHLTKEGDKLVAKAIWNILQQANL
jgi:lysophospholipase L1-like esterase